MGHRRTTRQVLLMGWLTFVCLFLGSLAALIYLLNKSVVWQDVFLSAQQTNNIPPTVSSLLPQSLPVTSTASTPPETDNTSDSEANLQQDCASAEDEYVNVFSLFNGSPLVHFSPETNVDTQSVIQGIAYLPGGGPGGCLITPQAVYEPITEMCSLWLYNTQKDDIVVNIYTKQGCLLFSIDRPLSPNCVFADDEYPYCIGISMPDYLRTHLGTYTISIHSKNGNDIVFDRKSAGKDEFTFSITNAVPSSPRAYLDGTTIYLINFHPDEMIAVHCFHDVFNYDPSLGDKTPRYTNLFHVGTSGELVISDYVCDAGVVEDSSGHLFILNDLPTPRLMIYRNPWRPFQNCPLSHIKIGDMTSISNTPPL